ncbi:uncharacterized protein LOC119332950 [Triticum dicoccoides]|uniref:uncharacterized protein LOC119332950 n=1 Tax=Triticum dicoccoides TaxID=85692 RepID=UPI001890D1D0|nr:uncharacterized protein LOC119332950 [Triticum dicoccoides]
MALVPDCPPDLRVYDSSYNRGYTSPREQSEHRSRLLRKIHDSYRKALERLNARARPGMAARFLHGGGGALCLGLLDPVSNIVANTLISRGEPGDLVHVPEDKLGDLERRSLDGLVAFLTRFFPYLTDCHAVRFLLLAGADLLAAVRAVASDLGMTRLGSSPGPAVEEALVMALRCAALAARHPDPDRLVLDWLAISGRLDDTVRLLADVRRRSPESSLDRLPNLLDGLPPPAHQDLWRRLTASRPPPPRRSVPHQTTTALNGTLQDALHGFYLEAIARLPAGELRSRLHRSLLVAGHCYGPLDPVSNIIINTIWHDAAFPPAVKLEVDVIGTMILHRTENCSLYGLVSFLCTRHRHLTDFDQAIYCLLQADGDLLLADRRLDDDDEAAAGLDRAFLAAATAAYHPNPDAQAKLLRRLCPCDERISSILQGSTGQLSSQDVQCLARLLCPEAACGEQPLRRFPHPWYLSSQTMMCKKINAALSAYAAMLSGEPMYELHTICGVNKYVSGPVGTDAKCYRTHVNFLATPKGTQFPAGTTPLLFFAEVCNDDDDDRAGMPQPFVCRVWVPLPCAGRVRCLYCDHNGY